MVNLCTKFERNRAICGGATASSISDTRVMTLNMCHVLR